MTDAPSFVLGIDPGPKQSSAVLYDSERERVALLWKDWPNAEMLSELREGEWSPRIVCAIERMMSSRGNPVTSDVLDTVEWAGRFREAWDSRHWDEGLVMSRERVKATLCGRTSVGDPNVRAALIDRHGGSQQAAKGTKKAPGPLYGVSKHCWAALAVAVAYVDRERVERT